MKENCIGTVRKKYNAIDLCKYFMAACVVAIHTQPLHGISDSLVLEIYSAVVRMAVPFFFMASGYLLAAKLSWPFTAAADLAIIKNYIKKMTGMYVIWTVIYLPWTIYSYCTSETPVTEAILSFLRGFFLLGEHSITWMLWYLLSTVYSMLVIRFLLKKQIPLKNILFLGFVLLLGGFFIDELMEPGREVSGILAFAKTIISKTIHHGRMFPGIFYLSLGMLLTNKKIPSFVNWGLFLGGFAANCAITNTFISQLLLVPSVTGLFGIVCSLKLPDSNIYPFLRRASTVLFLLHMYVFTLYNKLTHNADIFGMDCFLVCIVVCLSAAILYECFLQLRKRHT